MRAKITLKSVKAQAQWALYDTELKGFQVRRQAKATVHAVRRMVGKRNLQITIGHDLSPDFPPVRSRVLG